MIPSSPLAAAPFSTLVAQADAGDARARDLLFATLYDELHRLAQREVRRQGAVSPLSATTLLHEVYLAFGAREVGDFPDESRFLAYAAKAMRGVLIDRVRANHAAKRGGGVRATTLDTSHAQQVTDPDELLAIHDALETARAAGPDAGPRGGPAILLRLHVRRDRRGAAGDRAHGAAAVGQGAAVPAACARRRPA